MNFATKLIISIISVSAATVGSIWGAFEVLDYRMDGKVNEGKTEVLTIVHNFREERNALIKAQDDKVAVQLVQINTEMGEIRKDVRALLGIARKAQVFVEKENETLYTKYQTTEVNKEEVWPN